MAQALLTTSDLIRLVYWRQLVTTKYRSKSGHENHNLGYQRLPPFTERIVLSNRDKIYDLTLVTLDFSTFIVALKVQDLKQI